MGKEATFTLLSKKERREIIKELKELCKKVIEYREVKFEDIYKSLVNERDRVRYELLQKTLLDFSLVNFTYVEELYKLDHGTVQLWHRKGIGPPFPFKVRITKAAGGINNPGYGFVVPKKIIEFFFGKEEVREKMCFQFFIAFPDYTIESFMAKVYYKPLTSRKSFYYQAILYLRSLKVIDLIENKKVNEVIVLFAKPLPVFMCED